MTFDEIASSIRGRQWSIANFVTASKSEAMAVDGYRDLDDAASALESLRATGNAYFTVWGDTRQEWEP